MKKLLSVFLFLTSFAISISLHAQIVPAIEWQKSLGGNGLDVANSIKQTSDGGYIVAGFSLCTDGEVSGNHGGNMYGDAWIVKLDSAGNLQWQKCLGGSQDDHANSIQQTSDGGFIIAGTTSSNDGDVSGNHGSFDCWIVKIDSAGNLLWQKSLGGSSGDEGRSIEQTTDGGFIVAGSTTSYDGDVSGNHPGINGYPAMDYWIVRLDSTGDIVWQKCLGGSSDDFATSIQQTTDGGFVVAGSSQSNNGDVSGNHGYLDEWVVKIDSIGNLIWQKSLGGSNAEWASSVHQTLDKGFVVSGYTYSIDGDISGNHGFQDGWIVKLDATGNTEWKKCLGGGYTDYTASVLQTIDEGFIVAGTSSSIDGDVTGNHGSFDCWIVKLNAIGNITWQKCLGGSGNEFGYTIQQTTDTGFIVGGTSTSTDGDATNWHEAYDSNGYPVPDYWVVKLSGDIATVVFPSSNHFVSMYPNPVQSHLTINLTTPATQVTLHVYDLQGKMIALPTSNSKFQTSNSIQLNTENLPNGFYTLQIINNKTGESEVAKFVKQ